VTAVHLSRLGVSQRIAISRYVAGVTLVELMIALVIGMLLTVGAASVYLQSRSSYKVNDAAARLQETVRYALDIIEPDVRLAGYWGFVSDPLTIVGRAAPAAAATTIDSATTSNCGTNWTANVDQVAGGLDGTTSGGSGYNLSCTATGSAVAWADLLIVRHASPGTATLTNNRIQIQSSRVGGTLFSNGTMPAGYAASPISETHDLVVNAYYVSRVAGSPSTFPLWELRRKALIAGPAIQDEVVIPGIQDLQLQFGVDTDSDSRTDRYVNPESVPAGARVISVRIWLLAVSDEAEAGFTNDKAFAYANINHGAFNDSRRRLLVSKTIQLRNMTL
jgi:type IV pilus assembly protein PilW